MKQNYNLLTSSTAFPHAWNTFFLKSKTKIASLLVVLFTLFGFSDAFGQVTINTASGSINSCTYPTSYVALGNIFLEENNNGNFGFLLNNTDYTFIITAPANFEFQAGVGSVAFRAGEDITAANINVTATTITVTYRSNQMNRTNGDDRLTISGINFRGITAPSTGNMTRTALGGGTGVINGAGAGSVYGTLTSTNNPPPANGGGAASVCVGSATPAFTNATGGGTWSIIPGTGTATVTVGGVVTGTSAGTVTVRYTVNGCIANSALTVNPTPAAIGGGAATVCTGASTPAFTNAVGGGTWSVISGTGTASITGGGVLTGTTAGTVTVRYTLPAGCFVNSAVVTIQQTPGAIAGGSATVCNGASTPAFTNPNGGGTWSVLNGTGTATVVYTIGTCSVSTPITVISTPTISINPANANTNTGGTANFSVTALNGPTSYTWQVSTDGGGSWTTITADSRP